MVISFIAQLYSNANLNRAVVQSIVFDTRQLFNNILNYISKEITDESSNTIKAHLLEINNIFDNIKSDYVRLKYFETSKTFVRHEPFYIGYQTVLDNISKLETPDVKIKADLGQKCSLGCKLKMFLELPNVYNKILNYIHKETLQQNTVISSIWRNIQDSFKNKVVFPLLLFYDFEPCSRAVLYKVGAIYVTLACIPPQYASLQENIFLYQLNYTSDKDLWKSKNIF